MGKYVLGKEIAKLTPEERKELMAGWRARRKNGGKGNNGRLGYRSPDRMLLSTNDFPDPTKKYRPGEPKKSVNEHIKGVFVCRRRSYPEKRAAKSQNIYLLGFITDSNKYCFETFYEDLSNHIDPRKGFVSYLRKYRMLFEKKNIDKDTYFLICTDDINFNDLMPQTLQFMQSFLGCQYRKITKADLVKKLTMEYKPFDESNSIFVGGKRKKEKNSLIINNCIKYKSNVIDDLLDAIFEFLAKSNVCPWMTQEKRDIIWSLSKYKRGSFVLVSLGLFFTVLAKYKNAQYRLKKLEKEKETSEKQ